MENEEKTIQPKAIQIFAKAPGELGVNVVKSPVKLTILSMLKDTDMEFDEIVKNTGKSKSTISVHLKSLREDISKIVHSYKSVLQMHGFYVNKKEKSISFDIIIDFSDKNKEQVYKEIYEKVNTKYPEYSIKITMDFINCSY